MDGNQEFSNLIAEELGPEAREGLRAQFSTTGPFQNAAYDIALMNACRSVFSYSTHTLCGIPLIELKGSPDDWIRLGEKILKISTILSWTASLKTDVVDPIIAAANESKNKNGDNKIEAKHWSSFYKFESHSGGYNIDGWISLLFPFRLSRPSFYDRRPPTWEKLNVTEMKKTVRNLCAFMPGFSTVPMKWHYYGQDYDMRLLAGQVGVAQRDDGYIQPIWGWGVYHYQIQQ